LNQLYTIDLYFIITCILNIKNVIILGGGLESEGELIEIIEMSIDEATNYINSEEVQSPASFLNGVSWFLMNKKNRFV
jgi:hypothetical protein